MARILRGGSLESLPLERVDDLLFRNMKRHDKAMCMVNATINKSYTFGEVSKLAEGLALGLQALGLQRGDIVSLYGLNSEEFVFVTLATIRLGLTVNPINPAATPRELQYYFKEVQPRVIFTEKSLLQNIEAATNVISPPPNIFTRQRVDEHPHIFDLCTHSDDVTNIRRDAINVREDVAVILFSSGTTGLPKGVLLTHRNVGCQLHMRGNAMSGTSTCKLTIFPMYHVAGLISALSNIHDGITSVFLETYNITLMLESIQKYKPTHIGMPPPVIVQLTKFPRLSDYDLSSVVACNTGAAPLKKETEDVFKQILKIQTIQQGYGLTETCAGVIWSTQDDPISSQGSSGKVTPGTDIKIINTETGQVLGPYDRGEVLVRSPLVMKGYLNNPAATLSAIDQDGWLHTGDVGYYDDAGYVFVVDRLKELIKYKGNQVAPAELEALLLQHPDVEDVGVVGVPELEAGELPRAYIVKSPASNVTGETLQTYVKERASHYKQLRGGVVFLSEIPKLASGKILRNRLRELVQAEKSKL